MLYRLFTSVVTLLFLIVSHGQSHSAELIEKLYIPDSLSTISHPEQAIEFWKDHRHSLNINREAVRVRFSKITFDYLDLWKFGFDVLKVDDKHTDVFTNVSFIFSNDRENRSKYEREDGFGEDKMLAIVEDLAHSQITILSIEGSLTPKLGEALVTLLEGGKRFQELKIRFAWDYTKTPVYEMIKKIGMASTEKVGRLFIYKYCTGAGKYASTEESRIDFDVFTAESELQKIKAERELEEGRRKEYQEKQEEQRKQEQERLEPVVGVILFGIWTAAVVAVVVPIYFAGKCLL